MLQHDIKATGVALETDRDLSGGEFNLTCSQEDCVLENADSADDGAICTISY